MDILASLGVFAWAVPGALLAAPGLLLILVILAQSMGALAWLPIVRRKIGGFRPDPPLDAAARPRLDSRPHHEERAMNGTSTRRASAQRPGGWWKPGRRRRGMDPGASGPNGSDPQ